MATTIVLANVTGDKAKAEARAAKVRKALGNSPIEIGIAPIGGSFNIIATAIDRDWWSKEALARIVTEWLINALPDANDETETDILLALLVLQATAGTLFARAADEIERLRKRVAELEAREQRPDPLSQALNEGDGVYRSWRERNG